MKNKIIHSPEFKLINDYISKNVKSYKKINPAYDSSFKEQIDLLYNELNQTSFFSSNETIVIFFDLQSLKKITKNDIDLLKDLSNSKKEFILCFVIDNFKYEKDLNNYYEIINIPKLSYWTMSSLIEKILKENNIQFDQNDLQLLKSKLCPNAWIIENELKKIILNTKKLTTKFINENIIDYNNSTEYKLIENFFKANYSKALSIFEKIYAEKKSIDEIMAIFISYIFNLRTIMIFHDKNKNKSLIDEFKIQEFQEKQFLSIMRNISIDNIDNLLNNLIKLDKGIKSGKKDPYNSFKLLISGGYHG